MTSDKFPHKFPYRRLKWWEIDLLQKQGCSATDWNNVSITSGTSLNLIRNVDFEGCVKIGALSPDESLRNNFHPSIRNAVIADSIIGDNVHISAVPGGVRNATVGSRVIISNVARIDYEPEAPCGIGLRVDVLDESGSRPVTIFPGLSAQLAALMARMPKWADTHLTPLLHEYLDSIPHRHHIGDEALIRDCGSILNVFVDKEATVDGASSLRNGSIINNAPASLALSYVGPGVDAENFIFEDAFVGSGCIVRNCFVGQGASLDKGFTAHDSLFFANSALENGEACALFAGPYTVSMHKASLLIGCQTSFMNAGSATNQSNHMYKLGPVHWGVLERGVKTSSNSYLMLGANIGAFSLLMGDHKTHPDSTMFPFSYLFGDERGATVVVPGQMIRSCGLMRDEKKWPTRDKRIKRRLPLHDRIHFAVLNPYTVDRMLDALPIIDHLLSREADDDHILRWRGMKFSRASLERAKNLYTIAIFKYIHTLGLYNNEDNTVPNPVAESEPTVEAPAIPPSRHARLAAERIAAAVNPEPIPIPKSEWVDLAGQLIPRSVLQLALQAESIGEIENIFTKAFDDYSETERRWALERLGNDWRRHPAIIAEYAAQFDAAVSQDRDDYLTALAAENASLSL